MFVCGPVTGNGDKVSSLVKLALSGCAAVSLEETNRILDLELRSIVVGPRDDIVARPIYVTATCTPTRLELVARDKANRLSNRVIPIKTQRPAGMERIIAIAATELALSTWEQLSVESVDETTSPTRTGNQDTSPTAGETAHDPAEEGLYTAADHRESPKEEALSRKNQSLNAKEEEEPSTPEEGAVENGPSDTAQSGGVGFAAHLGMVWRMYLSNKLNLFGGELAGDIRFTRLFRLHLGVTPEGGRADRALGEISMFSVSGVLSLGILGRLFSSRLRGGADIGFRSGFGRLKGRPQSENLGDTLSGAFGGPLVSLFLGSATRPAVGLSVEVGYAFFGMTGRVGIGSPIEMKGLWISARLEGVFIVH